MTAGQAGAARVWAIEIAGPGRHDGERPHGYLIDADTLADAARRAWLVHLWVEASEHGLVAADGTVPSWTAARNHATGPHPRADDVLVLSGHECCCTATITTDDSDSSRTGSSLPGMASRYCGGTWWWRVTWAQAAPHIDLDRLHELGYPIHGPTPEHTHQ
ncbi:hypothetical protein [Nocardia wallacei]|uniref:hypothetical protein n=1 Tax=Nocardia wallacei TaxID=480035 RepID=UPI002458670B|nr:hypothetical protein [Nocardia wallacei]